MTHEEPGDPLGTHRSLEPKGALPQPAWRLANDMRLRYATEILVDVEVLNIDAASFRQMEEACGGEEGGVGRRIEETVRTRGKQHNPVTGSGGMLLGRVAWVGSGAAHRGVSPGDPVATLASLSLTPLRLDRIKEIRPASAQVDVDGQAVIFASAPFARMPSDLPARLALALFDVAGAAPQVARRVQPGDRVLVLGAGGKSGLLCCAEARRRGASVVLGVEAHGPYAEELRSLGLCDAVIEADARDPLAVRDALASRGGEVDVAFSCVNVDGAEMAAIVATRQRGSVYFFAMSTSFPRAALGAEGIGKDVDLFIGNGFAQGHAEHTLTLVREAPALRSLLERRYG
jgi:L-erythro-3,5-diaminohexanoate dehydrogenase